MEQILLVEDSRAFARLLKKEIETRLSFVKVVLAGTQQAAVQAISHTEGGFFLGILDLHLPDAPNGEIVDTVMAKNIPVIILTSSYDAELQKKWLAKRVLDFFVKNNYGTIHAVIYFIERYYRNGGVKVLVVDDSRSSRFLLLAYLRRYRFVVLEAAHGEEAWAILQQQPDIRLVVTDYNMPGMDGFELTKKIRSLHSRDDVAIIGVSAKGDPLLSSKFLKHGANDFINKPFQIEELLCRLFQNIDLIEKIKTISESAQRAKNASQTKSAFLANMSHEIRTPMNAIIGMTDLVLATPLTPEQQSRIRIVQSSADELLALINNILDISKIEAGRITLESIAFDLYERIENTTEILAVKAQQKGLALLSHIAQGVPRTVLGDPHRLHQILLNLFNNAIKFTECGEILLRVAETTEPENAPQSVELHFSVTDSGIGIPADRLDLIFGRFTQAEESTTRQYGGTGLGLAISKHLVELLGGRIWVESRPGHGSVFHFTCRFGRVSASQSQEAPRAPSPLSNVLVLLGSGVENERAIVREMLNDLGAQVLEVTEASGLSPTWHPGVDVVLVDHRLLLQEATPISPLAHHPAWRSKAVALLPTTVPLATLPESNRLPGMAVINKPVRRSDLLQTVERLLGRSGARPGEEKNRLPKMAQERLNILLVDDNKINQQVAVTILQMAGHAVTVASDGQEALDAWEQHSPFDLILMDLNMPDLHGYEVTQRIRATETARQIARTPIVALTANVLAGIKEQCLQNGMDGYLGKPYRGHELLELLSRFAPQPKPTPKPPTTSRLPPLLDDSLDPDQTACGRRAFLAQAPAQVAALRQGLSGSEPMRTRQEIEPFKALAATAGAVHCKMLATRLGSAILGEDWEKSAHLLSTLEETVLQTLQAIAAKGVQP